MTRRTFGTLSELNIVVADDLNTVAPGVEEIEKLTGERVHACLGQSATDGLFVIDHEVQNDGRRRRVGCDPSEELGIGRRDR